MLRAAARYREKCSFFKSAGKKVLRLDSVCLVFLRRRAPSAGAASLVMSPSAYMACQR